MYPFLCNEWAYMPVRVVNNASFKCETFAPKEGKSTVKVLLKNSFLLIFLSTSHDIFVFGI